MLKLKRLLLRFSLLSIVKVITNNSQKIKLMATKTATKYVMVYIIAFKNNMLDEKKGQ